jgi:hypothetical protein
VTRPSAPTYLRRRRPGLERAGRHPPADDGAGDDGVAAVEERLVVVGRAGAGGHVGARVREEQELVLRRLLRVDDDRQRVVVDEDELRRVDAGRPVLADHDRDDLADEADDVRRHRRPAHLRLQTGKRRRAERRQVDVGGGEDLHAGQLGGRRRVDAVDACVREQRADERHAQRPFDGHVLDVLALAPQEAGVLAAQDPVAEDAHAATGAEPTACWTASTIRASFGSRYSSIGSL